MLMLAVGSHKSLPSGLFSSCCIYAWPFCVTGHRPINPNKRVSIAIGQLNTPQFCLNPLYLNITNSSQSSTRDLTIPTSPTCHNAVNKTRTVPFLIRISFFKLSLMHYHPCIMLLFVRMRSIASKHALWGATNVNVTILSSEVSLRPEVILTNLVWNRDLTQC